MGRFAERYTEAQRDAVREAGTLAGATIRSVEALVRSGQLPGDVPRDMPVNTIKEFIRQGRRRAALKGGPKVPLSDTLDGMALRVVSLIEDRIARAEREPDSITGGELLSLVRAVTGARAALAESAPKAAAGRSGPKGATPTPSPPTAFLDALAGKEKAPAG